MMSTVFEDVPVFRKLVRRVEELEKKVKELEEKFLPDKF
jgi:hypothetical protein